MKNKLFLLSLCFILSSCSKNKENDEIPPLDTPYIEVYEKSLTVERIASTKAVNISTNIISIEFSAYPEDWCTLAYANGLLTMNFLTNTGSGSRIATITIQNKDASIKKTLVITQLGRNSTPSEILDDIKVTIHSANTSSFQPGGEIEKSFDGNLATSYHSNWNNSGANYFPITFSYYFQNVESIDYLIYYPRQSGTNGNIKQFDLYVITEDNPGERLIGSYDFLGSTSASRITFPESVKKPTEIKFIVRSGYGDGQGFVSCAEMEFYRYNSNNFDYSSVFNDPSCSSLKNGVTKSDINAISSSFFHDLAMEIYLGEYDDEFRVQRYKSWQHPKIMAEKNKTNTYGLRDNPTGIYADKGEEIIVLVGNENPNANISLFIQDPENKINGSSYPLSIGINKFTTSNAGLMYVMYYTETGAENAITINIPTGSVNGYFDSQKHTKEDWTRILNNATYRHFDLIGKYAVLTFETKAFKQYTPDGLALINAYDELVYLEQDFMGLIKYNCQYKNRAYFLVIYDSYMYASEYYTAYVNTTQSNILDVKAFCTTEIWGPAHELGHIHQTRPGLRWGGTTEVTNNIHSLYVQTYLGNTSRLYANNYYELAKKDIINAEIAHCQSSDVFYKLVPFWQLKLYMHDALGNHDFYKDVYQKVRDNPNPSTSGYCQLEFVKIVCEVANLNLTDFFEKWGFLKAVDYTLDDYGKIRIHITQDMVDSYKAKILSYPKPKHNNIYDITDANVTLYK